MALSLIEVSTASFRTTRSADKLCDELLKRLGYRVNYLAARLAIARSLGLVDPPKPIDKDDEDDPGRTIKGQQLFGEGGDPAAWLALLTQRSGRADLDRRELQRIVAAHWKRGAELLAKDWDEAQGSLSRFIEKLADFAALPDEIVEVGGAGDLDTVVAEAVILPVGEIAEDVDTREPVSFPLNAPGGSPHMAIMGGAGSGKTRTAAVMVKRMRRIAAVPLLAFDFKGDLASAYGLDAAFEAEIITPPRKAIPLDVFAVSQDDETSLREAAARIRDSIARVKNTRIGGVQSEALRDAVLAALRNRKPTTLADINRALLAEYQRRNRNPDELTATLSELTQFTLFDPKLKPADFFKRSWIISLPPDTSAEMRRLITNLTLDALDRWLNSLPEAPLVDGRRALRHLAFIDEAHVILEAQLPALGNLIRMSRSKGGVVALISQSPNDFEGQDDAFLDNVGLTVSFNTNAKPGPANRIFGKGSSLTSLPPGEALCRIRTEAKTRRVVAWKPD